MKLAAMDCALRFGSPVPRGRERGKRPSEALLVARAPRARLVGRATVALPAVARRAALGMADLDARELTHAQNYLPRNSPRDSARQSIADISGSGPDNAI